MSSCLLRVSNVGDLAALRAILAIFLLRMSRIRYLSVIRWTFWYRHSIPWSRFPYGERYFGDLKSFYVDFCIRYVESPPYFYFRSTWPADLQKIQSVSRVSPLTLKISTTLEVYTIILCLVIAFLLVIHYVTLRPWPLTFDLGQCHTWRVTWTSCYELYACVQKNRLCLG